jgi:hypothetical protein
MSRVVVVLAVLVMGACGKHLYSRDDLTVTLSTHHIDLRWGRLGNAALAVKPEMRAAFLEAWTARAKNLELQEIEVMAVLVTPDGNAADVMVNITYVDRETMSVKTDAVVERWARTDAGWVADKPAAL